jgi:hypothetical protein
MGKYRSGGIDPYQSCRQMKVAHVLQNAILDPVYAFVAPEDSKLGWKTFSEQGARPLQDLARDIRDEVLDVFVGDT